MANDPAVLIRMEPDGSRPNTLLLYDTIEEAQAQARKFSAKGYAVSIIKEVSDEVQASVSTT
jgi:hypothetical protein